MGNGLIERATAVVGEFQRYQAERDTSIQYYTAGDYDITYINQYMLKYSSTSSNNNNSTSSNTEEQHFDKLGAMANVQSIVEEVLQADAEDVVSVGMDTETGVFQWEYPNRCHVVQLSSGVTKKAVVIHISSFTDHLMFRELRRIIFGVIQKSDQILVYGGADLSMLYVTLNAGTDSDDQYKLTDEDTSKVLDLGMPYLSGSGGLKRSSKELLDYDLDKRYQCAYWRKQLLKPEEVSYAAIDAIVLPQ